jgi:hypothetical protein
MTSSRTLISVALVVLSAAGCSSTDRISGPPSSPSNPVASPSTSTPVAPIVGRWKQSANVHTCENFVHGMSEEGLLAAMGVSPPYVEGESWQQVAERYCSRSFEDWDVDHYHFFTSSGLFGSEDQNGQQVDDGNYKVRGTDTLLIGRSRFRYTVRGDTLTLDPVITATMRKEALAKPGKFTDAVWMVSVAVTGTSWNRVDCAWC